MRGEGCSQRELQVGIRNMTTSMSLREIEAEAEFGDKQAYNK